MVTIIKSRFTTNKFRTRKIKNQKGGMSNNKPRHFTGIPVAPIPLPRSTISLMATLGKEEINKRFNFFDSDSEPIQYEGFVTKIKTYFSNSNKILEKVTDNKSLNQHFIRNICDYGINTSEEEDILKDSYISFFDMHGGIVDKRPHKVPDNTIICFLSPINYTSILDIYQDTDIQDLIFNMSLDIYKSLFEDRHNINNLEGGNLDISGNKTHSCFTYSSWFYPGQYYYDLQLSIANNDIEESNNVNKWSCVNIDYIDKDTKPELTDISESYQPFLKQQQYKTIFDTIKKFSEAYNTSNNTSNNTTLDRLIEEMYDCQIHKNNSKVNIITSLSKFVNLQRPSKKLKLVIVPCCRPIIDKLSNSQISKSSIEYNIVTQMLEYDAYMYHINDAILKKTKTDKPEINAQCIFTLINEYYVALDKTQYIFEKRKKENPNLSGYVPKIMEIYNKLIIIKRINYNDAVIIISLDITNFLNFLKKLDSHKEYSFNYINILFEEFKRLSILDIFINRYNKLINNCYSKINKTYNYNLYTEEEEFLKKAKSIFGIICKKSEGILHLITSANYLQTTLDSINENYIYQEIDDLVFTGKEHIIENIKYIKFNNISQLIFLDNDNINNNIEKIEFNDSIKFINDNRYTPLELLLKKFPNLKNISLKKQTDLPDCLFSKNIKKYDLKILVISEVTLIPRYKSLNIESCFINLNILVLDNVTNIPKNINCGNLSNLYIYNSKFTRLESLTGNIKEIILNQITCDKIVILSDTNIVKIQDSNISKLRIKNINEEFHLINSILVNDNKEIIYKRRMFGKKFLFNTFKATTVKCIGINIDFDDILTQFPNADDIIYDNYMKVEVVR
jgi:hypothetical protein